MKNKNTINFFEKRLVWQHDSTFPNFGRPPGLPKKKEKTLPKEKLDKQKQEKTKLAKETKSRLTESPEDRYVKRVITKDLERIKNAKPGTIIDALKAIDFMKYGSAVRTELGSERRDAVMKKIEAEIMLALSESVEKIDAILEPQLAAFLEAYSGEADIDPIFWDTVPGQGQIIRMFTLLNTRIVIARYRGEKYSVPEKFKQEVSKQILGLAKRSANLGNLWNVEQYDKLVQNRKEIFDYKIRGSMSWLKGHAKRKQKEILADFSRNKPNNPKALAKYVMTLPQVHGLNIEKVEAYMKKHTDVDLNFSDAKTLPYTFDPRLLGDNHLRTRFHHQPYGKAKIDFDYYIPRGYEIPITLSSIQVRLGTTAVASLSGDDFKALAAGKGMIKTSKKKGARQFIYTDLDAFDTRSFPKRVGIKGMEPVGKTHQKTTTFNRPAKRGIAFLIHAIKSDYKGQRRLPRNLVPHKEK